MKNDNPWTGSQTAALTRMWMTTEFTASEIAIKFHLEIGDRTRNSILGKVHRLKLPMRCPENSHPGSHSKIRLVPQKRASERPVMISRQR